MITIEYEGPIRAEPLNQKLNGLDDAAAQEATADAMKRAFALVRT
jgi:hypothetical protein